MTNNLHIIIPLIVLAFSIGIGNILNILFLIACNLVFYIYVGVLLLIPCSIAAIYILYKTKSTEESFTKFQTNLNKLVVASVISQEDINSSWFLRTCTKCVCYGFVKIISITSAEPIFFDIWVGLICLKRPTVINGQNGQNGQYNLYLGMLGGWLPLQYYG